MCKLKATKMMAVFCIIVLGAVMMAVQVSAGEPTLTIKADSKTTARVELANEMPVRGLQFTVMGAKVTEVRTTSRTKEFIAKFNEKNGMVLMVSTSASTIAPGKGPVAEIVCDKPASAGISGEIIVKAEKKK